MDLNIFNNGHHTGPIKQEEHDQIFDLLNLSPTAEFGSTPFDQSLDGNILNDGGATTTSSSSATFPTNTPFLPSQHLHQQHQLPLQNFPQLGDQLFVMESPISDRNSPSSSDVSPNQGNSNSNKNINNVRTQNNHQHHTLDEFLEEQRRRNQQQQPLPQEHKQHDFVPGAFEDTIQYDNNNHHHHNNNNSVNHHHHNYEQSKIFQQQQLPLFNFDTPPPQSLEDHLTPNLLNNFYSSISNNNTNNNNSTSNLTIMSTHSYVSPSADANFDHQQDLSSNLLSTYEGTPYRSISTPSYNSPSVPPSSPFLSTSPYLGNDNSNNDDDNMSIYQTIEALNIDSGDHLDLNPEHIRKEYLHQKDNNSINNNNGNQFEIPQIVRRLDTNELTEDNLKNNNNMLKISTPVTINIQAPEEIAAKTPSLFSQSNSLRSTPLNSPRNRSRTSSFDNDRERPQLGSSLLPSFKVDDSPNDVQKSEGEELLITPENDDDNNNNDDDDDDNDNNDDDLLKPGDEKEFRRMRQGRRLSNASRSRSRSRSRSVDSSRTDILDPTKNREKMIELAAPHSNRRTQKHPSVHACHLCDKTFTRPYNLKSHLRTHTDERPFICGTCGKAFARQHDKKRHEDLHTGEKRFQCRGLLYDGVTEWGCGKRFARADALGRHFKTESGRECVRPLLEDERRRKNGLKGVGNGQGDDGDDFNIEHLKVTDDMLNGFDFNEIFASQMNRKS